MSWKTQNEGQKVLVQARVDVILLIDKRLYSRDGTTRTISNVRVLDKMTDPFPIIGEVLPLVMEITDWGEGRMDYNWLESLVIWSDAPVLIIQVQFLEVVKNIDVLSTIPRWATFAVSCDWSSSVDVTIAFPAISFRDFFVKSHHSGQPMIS